MRFRSKYQFFEFRTFLRLSPCLILFYSKILYILLFTLLLLPPQPLILIVWGTSERCCCCSDSSYFQPKEQMFSSLRGYFSSFHTFPALDGRTHLQIYPALVQQKDLILLLLCIHTCSLAGSDPESVVFGPFCVLHLRLGIDRRPTTFSWAPICYLSSSSSSVRPPVRSF